jgi:hypothetical protein
VALLKGDYYATEYYDIEAVVVMTLKERWHYKRETAMLQSTMILRL